ncbi:MAG: hypothetical protein M3N43_08625 [Actinomycetota bacterium]|nr:hypothetical protein [Actinomycetota bacterium]
MPTEAATPLPSASPSRLRRAGLFMLAIVLASVAGALVEWSTRWVLPAGPAVFLGRVAAMFPLFYWMPVILAEQPPWTPRRRTRFAVVVGVLLAGLAWAASLL